MKKIVLFLLSVYQHVFSPFFHSLLGVPATKGCRYSPTCSQYARIHIAHEGVIKGIAKTIARLAYCQPFAKALPRWLQQ